MSDVLGDAASWVVGIIDALGYVGLALIVALENVFPPIPSELILPLAGFLSAQGRMTFAGAVVASTVGSVVGALALYALGAWLGERRVRALVRDHGRWLMISEEDLDKAEDWFNRHGRTAVLIGRLVPLVRSLISIPAGVAGMPLGAFIAYTTLGSGIWNVLLIGGGRMLGDNWDLVGRYQHYLGNLVIAALVGAIVWFVGKRLLLRRSSTPDSAPPE